MRYTAVEETPEGDELGPLSVIVIGRDASDARLFSKLWRFLWYKDSGPEVSMTRLGQLERRAYLLLLAAQAGIPVEHVVAAGTAGADEDAVLVLREPTGVRLPALAPDQLTDDVLVGAWSMAEQLHGARVVHGTLTAGNVLRQHDGSIALMDFSRASGSAPRRGWRSTASSSSRRPPRSWARTEPSTRRRRCSGRRASPSC